MAKGKRSKGKNYVSKGEVGTNRSVTKAIRKEWNGSFKQLIAKQEAFKRGKRVMVTIPNPNKNETNKKFIRVNAKEVWRNA